METPRKATQDPGTSVDGQQGRGTGENHDLLGLGNAGKAPGTSGAEGSDHPQIQVAGGLSQAMTGPFPPNNGRDKDYQLETLR